MQAYEQLDIETIRYRTQHGLPITQEQQRWLVEQVGGPLEGKKTRCPLCEGEGRIAAQWTGEAVREYATCEQCGGDGYIASRTCRACKEEIGESVGDSDGLCQMCWEALTGYSWWDEVMGEPIGIEADICREIAKRQKMGKSKYGQQLADNPADIAERLQHLKEELLDGAIYCQWAIGRLKDEKGSSASHI